MKTLTLQLTFITHAFCGGAGNTKCAEVRAASIRGQLRWWFRVLGGRAGDGRPLRDQEDDLFGCVHRTARASKLRLAVDLAAETPARSLKSENLEGLNYGKRGHPIGYLLFPLRPVKRKGKVVESNKRGLFQFGDQFRVHVQWTGAAEAWDLIRALFRIFVEFGALGARSRRTAGGLALENPNVLPELGPSLRLFRRSNEIVVRRLPPKKTAEEAQSVLGTWLMQWRAHGRTGANGNEKTYPGFRYAKVDHDMGARFLEGLPIKSPAQRPALGLPIVQRYSKGGTVNWARDGDDTRFASPVLLRVRRLSQTEFEPLILFILPQKWNEQDKVRLKAKGPSMIADAVVDADLTLFNKMREGALPVTELFQDQKLSVR